MLRLTSLLAAVFALSAGAAQAATKNVHVGKGGLKFVAANVTINQGDAVHWIWDSSGHSVTSGNPPGAPDGQYDSDIKSNPFTFDHTYTAPGLYHYYCKVHFGAGIVRTA